MNRKLDKDGKLTIPIEMRRELGIKNGDRVSFELKDDKIIITKYKEKE